MPEIVARQNHHLSRLHDELTAALPSLAPVLRVEGAAGPRRVKAAGGRPGEPVYETLPAEPPDTVHLSWPDHVRVTEAQVRAVLAAHDPAPPAPPPHPLEGLDDAAIDADTEAAVKQIARFLREREGIKEPAP